MPFKLFQKHGCSNPKFLGSLNSQRWRFLRRGLDDFREGFLPSCKGTLVQPAASPLLLPRNPEKLIKASQKTKTMLPKPQSYTSKLCALRQARNDHIAHLEYSLSHHSLATYPHLQESIPAELFKEVMKVLDPEMLPVLTGEEAEADTAGEHQAPSRVPFLQKAPRNRNSKAKRISRKGLQHKNPYTWFASKAAAVRELEAKLNYVPPLDKNIKRAAKELCDGFLSLGGEKYNLDEDTILSLFEADYKTNLPIFLPIYAEKWHDFPMDFRSYVELLPPQTTRKNLAQNGSSCKDAEFMQLHGTHAFREFLERKCYRIPEFLQQALEEQEPVGPKAGTSALRMNFRDAKSSEKIIRQ